MTEFTHPTPDQEPAPSIPARLQSLQLLVEGKSSGEEIDVNEFYDHATGVLFDPEHAKRSDAGLVGGSAEAMEAVREGLVSKLERVAHLTTQEGDMLAYELHESVLPVLKNFTEPEPPVLEVMKRRTDDMEQLFSVQELEEAIIHAPGRYISYAGEVDHPDFSWVQVAADNHSHRGINYDFYKEKPAADEKKPHTELSCTVEIGSINKEQAPDLVDDQYPYFLNVHYEQYRWGDRTIEESLDIPEELAPLLGDLAKTMITETLVEQGAEQIERLERSKKYVNELARDLVADVVDPVEARELLEDIGIHDDPDKFR